MVRRLKAAEAQYRGLSRAQGRPDRPPPPRQKLGTSRLGRGVAFNKPREGSPPRAHPLVEAPPVPGRRRSRERPSSSSSTSRSALSAASRPSTERSRLTREAWARRRPRRRPLQHRPLSSQPKTTRTASTTMPKSKPTPRPSRAPRRCSPRQRPKARELLNELVSLAEQYRGAPDAKVLARASRRLALRPQDRAGVELRHLPQREFLEVRGKETGQRLRYFSCQSSKTRSVQRSFRWSRTPSACSRSSF